MKDKRRMVLIKCDFSTKNGIAHNVGTIVHVYMDHVPSGWIELKGQTYEELNDYPALQHMLTIKNQERLPNGDEYTNQVNTLNNILRRRKHHESK